MCDYNILSRQYLMIDSNHICKRISIINNPVNINICDYNSI